MNKNQVNNLLIALASVTTLITLLEISIFLETIFSNDSQSSVKMFAHRVAPTYIYAGAWSIFGLFWVKWFGALLMLFKTWWGYWIYILLNVLALAFVLFIVITLKVMNYQPWLIIGSILLMGTGYTIVFLKRKVFKESTK
jgi:hypothetical protein